MSGSIKRKWGDETLVERTLIAEFLGQKKIAIVGVSRGGSGFGNIALKELKGKGYTLYPVHPEADSIAGERCYPSLKALPGPVDGLLVVVPPAQTMEVVREAHAVGIRRVWMQQGAESSQAIEFCNENGMQAITGECVLMFAEPAMFLHRAHRFVKGIMGQLPQ
jgi:uncharacterized protein